MKNIEMKVKDKILTIKIDLTRDFGPSKSGKTTVIATTSGNVGVPDSDAKIGVNVYKSA